MSDHNDSKEQESRTPAPLGGKEFAARRTIVKGMASAVPVVMTIGSGQALAQVSLSCIVTTSEQANLDVCIDAGDTDEYVRIPSTPENCPVESGNGNRLTGDQLKLIYVDENGNMGNSNSIHPVTQSCYASFL